MFSAKQSVWVAFKLWRILLIWTIVPIIFIVADIIKAKCYKITISGNMIIKSFGVLNKHNEQYAMAGITSVYVDKTFFGGICNYGTVCVSLAGGKTVSFEAIAKCHELESYIQSSISKMANSSHMFVN